MVKILILISFLLASQTGIAQKKTYQMERIQVLSYDENGDMYGFFLAGNNDVDGERVIFVTIMGDWLMNDDFVKNVYGLNCAKSLLMEAENPKSKEPHNTKKWVILVSENMMYNMMACMCNIQIKLTSDIIRKQKKNNI